MDKKGRLWCELGERETRFLRLILEDSTSSQCSLCLSVSVAILLACSLVIIVEVESFTYRGFDILCCGS
jgi:hypothetical protein